MRTARAASILAVGFLLGTIFVGAASAGCNSLVNQPTTCAVVIYEYQKRQAQDKVAGLGGGPSTDGLADQAEAAIQDAQGTIENGPDSAQDAIDAAGATAEEQAEAAQQTVLGPLGETGEMVGAAVDGQRDHLVEATAPDVVWAQATPGLVAACAPAFTLPSGADTEPLKNGVDAYGASQEGLARDFLMAQPNSDFAGAMGFVGDAYGNTASVGTKWYDWVFYPVVIVPLANSVQRLAELPDLAEEAEGAQALLESTQGSIGASYGCMAALELTPPMPAL